MPTPNELTPEAKESSYQLPTTPAPEATPAASAASTPAPAAAPSSAPKRSRRPLAIAAVLLVVAVVGVAGFLYYRSTTPQPTDVTGNANDTTPDGSGDPTDSGGTNGVGGRYDLSLPGDRDWKRYDDVNEIRQALERYLKANKNYPDDLAALAPTFLETVPTDPSEGQSYVYVKDNLTFTLTFTVEKGLLAYAPGNHTATPQGFDVPAQQVTPPADEVTTVQEIAATGEQPVTPQPVQADADGDKLVDADEASNGTDPANPDTDGDGLGDGFEVFVSRTNPLKADTDDDGFTDGSELENGYDPNAQGVPLSEQRRQEIETARAQFDAR